MLAEKASISILSIQTIKNMELTSNDFLPPPPKHECQWSIGCGDLDEALCTLKEGQTQRHRSTPSSVQMLVNKVFIDG
ncbi:hypothetical protein J3R82DRAFT_1867 [Butyriboletus roseoflavus]|nr:hypothetical protein J3R82DRAFT_1867 [Butyriboletus roseoflavus]